MNEVVQAIEKYSMIEAGEEICVALSGGKDSISLLYILFLLQKYSHLDFSLSAIHIKTAEYKTDILSELCLELDISYLEGELSTHVQSDHSDNPCYLCSRLKRGAISAILSEKKIRKAAYGHHADDVAETLFMNIIQTRKLGSFSPKVSVEKAGMEIIRPMIYLEEKVISRIHSHFNLPLLDYTCPNENRNLRTVFKSGVAGLNQLFQTERISKKIVDALENIDTTNLWNQEQS